MQKEEIYRLNVSREMDKLIVDYYKGKVTMKEIETKRKELEKVVDINNT